MVCRIVHTPTKSAKIAMKRRDPFYSTAVWQRIRDAHIKREPLCRVCRLMGRVVPGKHVDHIVPRELAGSNPDRDDNLQTLCQTHHNQKTACERAGKPWRIKGCDVHGQPLDPSHPWYA